MKQGALGECISGRFFSIFMFFMSIFHVYSKSPERKSHIKREYSGDQRG